jgi:hypothetical protein
MAWHPKFKQNKLEIEKIQHRATRFIPSLKGLSYEERLRMLRLSSLEYCRRMSDMLQVYKILSGIDSNMFFFTMVTCSRTRGHSQKIVKLHARLGMRYKMRSARE